MASGNIEKVPAGLEDAIASGKCVVFVGAGLSQGAGFPSWQNLLVSLTSKATSDNLVSDSKESEILQMVHGGDRIHLLQAAEELRDCIGSGEFRRRVAEVFKDNSKKPTPVHEELTKIDFQLAITTNYDKLLESAYSKAAGGMVPPVLTHATSSDFVEYLFSREFCILKAHGDAHSASTLVIAERDYRELLHGSPGYKAALSAVFTTKSVLFLGASLMDPELWLLLGYLRDAFHGKATRHYALIPKGDFAETEFNRWRKDFHVHCIHYAPSNDSHPEVLDFLKGLPHVGSR